LNGGAGDRASVLLPVVPFDPSSVLQPLPLDSRPENEQPIATVPTANGGTRRKHHRPWTLREVMTLVEGVARCGGGKWADIKKLAFSNVGYRTAVDLKVSLLSRHLVSSIFLSLVYRSVSFLFYLKKFHNLFSIFFPRSAASFLAVL
jgi:hypothetical protein